MLDVAKMDEADVSVEIGKQIFKGQGSTHLEGTRGRLRRNSIFFFCYCYELNKMFAEIKADRCDSLVGHYSFRAIKSNKIYILFAAKRQQRQSRLVSPYYCSPMYADILD